MDTVRLWIAVLTATTALAFSGCERAAAPSGAAPSPAVVETNNQDSGSTVGPEAEPAPPAEAAQTSPPQPRIPGRLLVGDPVPALTASRWFRGEPRVGVTPGRVTLVEFWATWCGPCIESMPHVSELAERHAGEGLEVIGVSIDRGDNAAELVERFLESRAEIARFDVMLDDGSMQRDWFSAAGQSGIPCSMVVDRQGRLAWVGHPLEQDPQTSEPMLDAVVRGLLDGTYDTSAALQSVEAELAEAQRRAQAAGEIERLTGEMGRVWAAGDRRAALSLIDQIVALDPESGRELAVRKVEILLYELQETGEALAAAETLLSGPYHEHAAMHMTVASAFSGELDPGEEGRALAVRAAQRAVTLTDGTDLAALAVLAEAHFASGDASAAAQTMQDLLGMIPEEHPAYTTYELVADRYRRALPQENAAAQEGPGAEPAPEPAAEPEPEPELEAPF